nr:MAG TPA: hypothetical protein [Caudoviricetes sp.]
MISLKYRVKRVVYTSNSNTAISLLHKGFKLQSAAYFVSNSNLQHYTLVKFGL